MSSQSDIRKLIAELEAQGAIVERGTSHWKVKLVSGQLVAILPVHRQSDRGNRGVKNVRAQLRRAGFDV